MILSISPDLSGAAYSWKNGARMNQERAAEDGRPGDQTSGPGAAPGGGDSPRRVLVVDDEASVLKIMGMALTALGYTVATAASAGEALQIAADPQGKPVDVLISDLRMPDMGGKEFAREFLKVAPHAKVIFMSGMSFQAAVERAGLEEKDYFLSKPVRIATLRATIEVLLNHSSEGPGA